MLRQLMNQQSPYDARPISSPRLSAGDNGMGSAYPGTAPQNVAQPMDTGWMQAIERRLGAAKQQDQGITGKTVDGKGKMDYITPRSYK